MGQSKILQEWCKQVSAVAIAGNAVGYVMEKKISITNHFDFVQSSRMELSSLRKKVATLDALLKPREKIMPHFLNLPRAQCPKERIKKERIYCYEWLYECGVSNVDVEESWRKANRSLEDLCVVIGSMCRYRCSLDALEEVLNLKYIELKQKKFI